jgi:hypothetical protein
MVFISDASGRFNTSYVASCIADNQVKVENNITDNYNFRLFLQRNALALMEKDRKTLSTNIAKEGCGRCKNCLLSELQKYKN